jgi:hypothetical protein
MPPSDVGIPRFITYFERFCRVANFASRRTVRPVGVLSAFFDTPAFLRKLPKLWSLRGFIDILGVYTSDREMLKHSRELDGKKRL